MIVKVHRPTHILADEGLHAVSVTEAARLVAIGAASIVIEPEFLPHPETDPEPEKKPATKKRAAKKKTTTKK